MMQQPSTGGGASMMDQQQQPTTTSTAQEEEEEKEFRTLWIGNLQNWRDKVEGKELRTLWIGDLQHWMDETYIHRCFAHTGDRCFAHTGEVFTSEVIRNKKTGESKCYGFIEFKSRAIAESFLHKFNGTPMPRMAGTNFSLNWASSFGLGEGEDDDLAAADDITISLVGDDDDDLAAASDFMLPQETFTSLKDLDLDSLTAKQISNEGVNSSWEDMLKWRSIAQGTRTPQEVLAVHRVHVIGAFFKIPDSLFKGKGVPPEIIIEELLDELPRYVDSIDIAKELHSIDALDPLLYKLYSQHAGIREKAAKVISTMAKKNPSSRQLVMEAGGEKLYHTYIEDSNPIVETNALDAISSIFWNDEPSNSAFGQKGYADLIKLLKIECVNLQRKALNLIARLVYEHNSDYSIVTALEYPSIMMRLASSFDAVVRKAALNCLIVLARVDKCGNSGQVVKNDDKLKQILQERIEVISAMALEGAADKEEIKLVDSLWNACYNNKPSSLRKKGLLV